MSFANLKRQSGNLDKLTKAVEALNQGTEAAKDDDNYWKPTVDKSGNGMAVLRFLPAPSADGDDALPWVKIHSHGFQGPTGQWLIDNCLTTKNQQCPICEHNSTLWDSGIEANKDIVRKQKRKLNYFANVYIVSDPSNKDNEGKVFLFRFGKKIFDKITEAMNPQFEDEKPINPFDMWKGANFKLKIRKVDGYQNYDKSEFESPAPLLDDDDELEKIYNSEYSLQELLNKPSEWKTYDQLKARLEKVLGLGNEAPKTTVEKIKAEAKKAPTIEDVEEPAVQEDEDDMAYFAKLAEED